jgi:hypothetical protein
MRDVGCGVRERGEGQMGERPVAASNGQYWRAIGASMVISNCFVAVKYLTNLDFDTALNAFQPEVRYTVSATTLEE